MSDLSLALTLGGGGARGIAHVHVLEALDELGIKPIAISGCSIGAIVGAGYANGMSGREVGEFLLHSLGNKSEVLARLWKLRPASVRELFSGSPAIFGNLDPEKVLRSFMPENLPETFEQLEIPLTVLATDFFGQNEVPISSGKLFPAMAASVAIPAVFKPVMIDGRVMIDGGIVNPVPFDHLPEHADIVLAVDVIGAPEGDPGVPPKRMESLIGASQLLMQAITSLKVAINPPDILIRPDINSFRVFDFLKTKKILEKSAGTKDEVKRAVEAAFLAKRKLAG